MSAWDKSVKDFRGNEQKETNKINEKKKSMKQNRSSNLDPMYNSQNFF